MTFSENFRPLSAALTVAIAITACAQSPATSDRAADSATSTVSTQVAAEAVDEGQCDAYPALRFVGYEATPDLLEQARVTSGASAVRALRVAQAMTVDYRASRLSLDTDAANLIYNVTCG
ncbi:MAG: I78 family peptidase inhibitor [Lysobacterales bacterium]